MCFRIIIRASLKCFLTVVVFAVAMLILPLPTLANDKTAENLIKDLTNVNPPVELEQEPGRGLEQAEEQEDVTGNLLDEAHAMVSGGVVATGKWIDALFTTERYEDEENKTSLVLRFSEFVDEDGEEFKLRTKVRLKTPNLNKRFKIFIIGEEGAVDSGLTDVERVEQAFESVDEDSITAGLLYRYRDTLRKNITLKVGLRVRDSRLVSFVEPRFRWREQFDVWDLYFVQKFGWFSDNGFNTKTQFDFDRALSDYQLIRATFEGNWYEDLDGYFYNAGAQYNHLLRQNKGLSYQWNNAFIMNSASLLNATVLKLVYRQRIWRDWLSMEIAPQVNYPRDNDFEAEPGLFLRFDIRFDKEGGVWP